MEYKEFGKTDLKVSKVGMGTWQASLKGWGTDYTRESIIGAIRESFDNGINFFDTAEIYGEGLSEKILSEALSIYRRDDYIIATKIAPFNLNNPWKSLENSIKRLNAKYIDLYQVHWPPSIYSNMEKLFSPLKEMVKSGKVRYIGVSNFNQGLLEKLDEKGFEIVSNQVNYSILRENSMKDLVKYMKMNRIELIAYSPLEMGALTGKYGRQRKPNGYMRKTNAIFKDIEKLEKLNQFLLEKAKKHNCTVSQLSLAYVISKGHLPIPGAKNRKQAKENAEAYQVKLADDEIMEMEKFVGGLYTKNRNFFTNIRYVPSFLLKIIFPFFI